VHHPANKRWIPVIGGSLIVLRGTASADAGYQDTTQITGGALVQMVRSIPFMPKSTTSPDSILAATQSVGAH